MIRVAVDVGGTFTDICVLDETTAATSAWRRCLDAADPIEGVLAGVEQGGHRPRATPPCSRTARRSRPTR